MRKNLHPKDPNGSLSDPDMGKELFEQLKHLDTEQRNPDSVELHSMTASEIAGLMNHEDHKPAKAISKVISEISTAIEKTAKAHRNGGRLYYIGAGTSGRLGVLDAAECPPTFGTSPDLIQGIIAGGDLAMFQAVENAEDSEEEGARVIRQKNIRSLDVVCGLAASGRTPYVSGAILEAQKLGAFTILITAVAKETLHYQPDLVISLDVGPEVIMGSTRLKSATAQKMVLNMISTGAMVLNGKVYQNVMVDLQATNQKLRERSIRTLLYFLPLDYDAAAELLKKAEGHVKTALLMHLRSIDRQEALHQLELAEGHLEKALHL